MRSSISTSAGLRGSSSLRAADAGLHEAGNLDAALHVAMTMAGMTSALSPTRLRKQAEKALDKYGSIEPDLSHLTDEQLQAMRELLEPGKLAAPIAADAYCTATRDSESAQLALSDAPDRSD